jgi:threonine/homoserine/homoserine lactone efflux protein
MGEAIGQSLSLAVGVALSPVPIIAVVLMLVSPRGRGNGIAFVVGWLVGLGALGTVALLLAGQADPTEGSEPATWVGLLKLALGGLTLLLAVAQWRKRPRGDAEPAPPKWMGAIDAFTPIKALGAGAALAAVNPKNLLLGVSAAAAIATTGIPAGEQAVAYAVFAVVGTIGVAAPVVLSVALGSRSAPVLESLRAWMAHNSAVIMAVLLLVIGAKLVGDGISSLSAG